MRYQWQRHIDHPRNIRAPSSRRAHNNIRSNDLSADIHTSDTTTFSDDTCHLGKRMNLDTKPIGTTTISPHNRVVTKHTRRRLVKSTENRQWLTLTKINRRNKPLDLGRADHLAVDTQ